jgi:hypothetical protein
MQASVWATVQLQYLFDVFDGEVRVATVEKIVGIVSCENRVRGTRSKTATPGPQHSGQVPSPNHKFSLQNGR